MATETAETETAIDVNTLTRALSAARRASVPAPIHFYADPDGCEFTEDRHNGSVVQTVTLCGALKGHAEHGPSHVLVGRGAHTRSLIDLANERADATYTLGLLNVALREPDADAAAIGAAIAQVTAQIGALPKLKAVPSVDVLAHYARASQQ